MTTHIPDETFLIYSRLIKWAYDKMNRRYLSVNDWVIDHHSGSICNLITMEQKRLGEYQLKLLDILAQNAGQILTREALTAQVWERRVIGNNSLPNAIHVLRVALEDDGKKQQIIKTIPKKGYLLERDYCRLIEKEDNEKRDDTLNMSTVEESARHDVSSTEYLITDRVRENVLQTPEPVLVLPLLRVQRWCSVILLITASMLITVLALRQL